MLRAYVSENAFFLPSTPVDNLSEYTVLGWKSLHFRIQKLCSVQVPRCYIQVWGLCSVLMCFLIAFQSIFPSGILILWWCSMVKSCSAVPFNLYVHKQSGKAVCVIYFRVFILTILFSQARIPLTWKLSTINCHPFSALFDFTFICFKISLSDFTSLSKWIRQ